MKQIAQLYSILLHPLLIPIYSLIALFILPVLRIQQYTTAYYLMIIGLLAINTVVLPIITFHFLQKQGSIRSFAMKTAAERELPYFILAALYAISTVMLIRNQYIDATIVLIPMVAAANILAMIPINRHLKISAHMTAIGSAIAYFVQLHFYYQTNLMLLIIFSILTAGIIASSRLYLKAHTTTEIYSGLFLGVFMSFLIGSFYLF